MQNALAPLAEERLPNVGDQTELVSSEITRDAQPEQDEAGDGQARWPARRIFRRHAHTFTSRAVPEHDVEKASSPSIVLSREVGDRPPRQVKIVKKRGPLLPHVLVLNPGPHDLAHRSTTTRLRGQSRALAFVDRGAGQRFSPRSAPWPRGPRLASALRAEAEAGLLPASPAHARLAT